MNKVYIYTLSDPRTPNNIRYIGKAKNLKARYRRHICIENKDNYHKASWIKCLKKQRLLPLMEEVDFIDEILWQYWEQFYISLFKSWGFDLTNTSDGGKGGWTSEMIKNKAPVIQFSKDGQFIKEYPSIKTASKVTNIDSSGVSHCASGSLKQSGGFVWIFKKDFSNQELGKRILKLNTKYKFTQERKEHMGRAVMQFDKNTGNFIKEYPTTTEAAKSINVTNISIQSCAKLKTKSIRGYIWLYKDTYSEKLLAKRITANMNCQFGANYKNKRWQPVLQFDIIGNYIAEYPSISHASKATEIPNSTIYYSCNSQSNSGREKFYWIFKNDIPLL